MYSHTHLPDGFLPNAIGARNLDDAIRNRLADSLELLARACGKVVSFDEVAVRQQASAIRVTKRLPPDIFLQYYEALEAARKDKPESLAAVLERISCAPVITLEPATVRALDDHSLPQVAWARYRKALRVESEADLVLQAPIPAVLAIATSRLNAARSLLANADLELAAEIDVLIAEVVLAQATPNSPRGFGGATSFQAWGATFLNAASHTSVVSVADGLVHEAAHALLMGLSGGEPMVLNDPKERHASPLRPDLRPVDGIFHATFVSARMCYAADRMLAANILVGAAIGETLRIQAAALRAYEAGLMIVETYARPTPVGARAMKSAISYMSGRNF